MSKLRSYLAVSTFLVLIVTAAYLEFPMVTALILIFILVYYFWSNDSKGLSTFGNFRTPQFFISISFFPATKVKNAIAVPCFSPA